MLPPVPIVRLLPFSQLMLPTALISLTFFHSIFHYFKHTSHILSLLPIRSLTPSHTFSHSFPYVLSLSYILPYSPILPCTLPYTQTRTLMHFSVLAHQLNYKISTIMVFCVVLTVFIFHFLDQFSADFVKNKISKFCIPNTIIFY